MTIQGYEGPGAQVFSEEEVNRRRATSGRGPAFGAGARPRAPLTPSSDTDDDPRRALCSNAELLDALGATEDADSILDRYQAVPQRADPVIDHASAGRGELDVDDILQALVHHHDDARAARPDAGPPRGTADLAPTIPTTRPRRHRAASSSSRRQSPPGRKTALVVPGLLIVIGLSMWATLSIAGAHRSSAPPTPLAGGTTALTSVGHRHQAAPMTERLVADRARTAIALTRARNRARAAAAAQHRHRQVEARRRQVTHTRSGRPRPDDAAAVTAQTSQVPRDAASTVTTPQVATGAQTPAQSTAAPETNHPASSDAPAFGQDGTLGPGHSPDS